MQLFLSFQQPGIGGEGKFKKKVLVVKFKMQMSFLWYVHLSDTTSRCLISEHGAPGQNYGVVDRPGGFHRQQWLPVVHSGITQE